MYVLMYVCVLYLHAPAINNSMVDVEITNKMTGQTY